MKKSQLCTNCGNIGPSKRHMPGSLLIEIVLWCFFIVPGLIYSLWRHSASKPSCAKCGSQQIIPADSPMAKKLQAA